MHLDNALPREIDVQEMIGSALTNLSQMFTTVAETHLKYLSLDLYPGNPLTAVTLLKAAGI